MNSLRSMLFQVVVNVDDSALTSLSEPDGRGGRRPSPNAARTAGGMPVRLPVPSPQEFAPSSI